MKLLFDATELSYYNNETGHRAGVFFVALNLFNELKRRDIDITFCCDFKRYYFLKNIVEFESIPILEEHSFLNKFWGKSIYITRKFPLKIKYFILILSRFYDSWFYVVNKKNYEQLRKFDIYFSPFTPPSKEVATVDLKRIRMIHDTIPIIESGLPKSPKDWYYKIYNSINPGDYYVTNSEQTRKDVLKYFPQVKESHIKTTLLGVNENFKPIKKTDDKKYVFSLCTLGKRKNLGFTIRNFFKFIEKNEINDLYLVLGGGIWKKFEKELISTLGYFDRSKIIMTGYIKDEELLSWYSNALMFVYPSLYEGFGLPVLEAMKCGCPVITSNTSSLPEVIQDAGIQIDPTDDSQMLNAFEKMYYDKSYRELCREKGLKRAKNFSWEKCVDEILEYMIE